MRITVVGGGVSGLTTALTLRRAGHDADIIAAARGVNSTSIYAAAIWFPVRDEPQEVVVPWSMTSLARFEELADTPGSGVRIMQISELFDHPITPGRWSEGVTGFRILSGDEVPDGYVSGMTMTVPQINPPTYLPWLEARLDEAGGSVEILDGPLTDLAPLFTKADVVINCTGLGSRDLVGDGDLFPIRGQVVAVKDASTTRGVLDETGGQDIAYVFPRPHEIILGGTRWPGDWSQTPDDAQTARILRECKELIPGLVTDDVVEVRVGLRPGRATVRLETEITPDGPIIHNYGHSGNGYILSWGCAESVAREVAALAGA